MSYKKLLPAIFSILFAVKGNTINYHGYGVSKEFEGTIISFIIHVINQHRCDKTGITVISTTSMDARINNIILQSVRSLPFTNGMYFFAGENFTEVPLTTAYIIISFFNDEKFLDQLLFQRNILNVRSTIILVPLDNPKVTFLKKELNNLWTKNYFNILSTFFQEDQLFCLTYNDYNKTYQKFAGNYYYPDIFEEKTRNLFKNPVNVLFTFNDHTKIRRVKEFEGIDRKYEGKDYDIIKTIFENLNANMSVIDIDDTIPDTTNNPWFSMDMVNKSDLQKDILRKWNITMLTKSQRVLEEDGVIEVTYPHTDNAVTLLVPKRQKITKPVEVYNYLMQPVWLIHLLVFTVLAICLSIMWRVSEKSCEFEPVNQLVRIMITCSTHGFWRKPFEDLFILAWIIWCFLASIMAQAKITSMLSTDLYENELDSLEDIYRKQELGFIIFGLNSYIDEITEKYEGSKYMKLISEMVKVPIDENFGEVMLLEMPKPTTFKMSIVLEHDIAKFYSRHLKNRQDGFGRPLLHMMKHNIMPCFQVFHVTAGSPLLRTINRKIQQLVEGGFIDLFKERFLFKGLIDGYLYPDEEYDIDNYEPTPINMELAKHAFLLLHVGLMISTAIFSVEILVHGVKKIFKAVKIWKVNLKKYFS